LGFFSEKREEIRDKRIGKNASAPLAFFLDFVAVF